jgi:hypothetical protein
MKLTINNIGKLRNAEVVIDGITVITGENNTGKSTVGKILWSIFDSFYNLDKIILNKKEEEVKRILSEENIFSNKELEHFVKKIMDNKQLDDLEKNSKLSKKNFDSIKRKIEKTLLDDESGKEKIILMNLKEEFGSRIKNIFMKNEKAKILLKIKNDKINIEMTSDDKIKILDSFVINEQVPFIDNPYILDELGLLYSVTDYEKNHRNALKKYLKKEKIDNIYTQKNIEEELNMILKSLNDIIDGELKIDEWMEELFYTQNYTEEELDIKSISTGIKTFAIIKILLQNGTLKKYGTIILDEPEIHLHPEWQLKFAELIVLLQKEFGMHILLTTHSPYFVSAIEVFSEKYKVDDKCKYYVAENNGNSSVIRDITGNTREIYKKMARPLQDLENIRYDSDFDEE